MVSILRGLVLVFLVAASNLSVYQLRVGLVFWWRSSGFSLLF